MTLFSPGRTTEVSALGGFGALALSLSYGLTIGWFKSGQKLVAALNLTPQASRPETV